MAKHAKAKKLSKQRLSNKIIQLLRKNPQLRVNYKQIAKQLAVSNKAERNLIIEVLKDLEHNNFVMEISRGKYQIKAKEGYITGKIEMHSQGNAHCISDDFEKPVFISHRNLHCALDGDTVKIFLLPIRKNKEPEGIVAEVVERSRKKIVGTIQLSKSYAFLIPDNRKVPYDIFIPPDKLPKGIKDNLKATVKITEWTEKMKNPIGEIIDILGAAGENETEQHAILEEFELPYKFPDAVEKEAKKIPAGITPQEIAKRKDFRNVLTFTIDPIDAKDFDDAISYRVLKNGNFEIGVHIADVSRYIRPHSIIDKEAYKRGTSVYLVDRVVPMLPETLSNNLCSLRPNEDKLTFSVLFEFDANNYSVVNHSFHKTIIRSDRRFNYDEVQAILDNKKGDFYDELRQINDITQKIRQKRFDAGALSFERTEIKFKLDEKGKPLGVIFKETNHAHQLIEELMLMANKYVARAFNEYHKHHRNTSFVYRVHDKPNQEKLNSFAQFIKQFGYSLNLKSRKSITSSMNNLLDAVKGKDIEDIVINLSIRSMAKAVYDTTNIGHYGLAFKNYTHFTSPIRRYPDLMVHRELNAILEKKPLNSPQDNITDACRYLSQQEQKAADAERMSMKFKQMEFMSNQIGKTFDGVISGVAQYGLFVEITENKSEGLVSIRDIKNDFFVYDEANYRLVSFNTDKQYQLGQKVKVRIKKVNIPKRQMDLELV